jgi:hypothetical protein
MKMQPRHAEKVQTVSLIIACDKPRAQLDFAQLGLSGTARASIICGATNGQQHSVQAIEANINKP